MKYCIQNKTGKGKNAGSKAVYDVTSILANNGFKPLYVYHGIFCIFSMLYLWLKLNKRELLILQWPIYYSSTKLLVKLIIKKKIRLILLLHDINKLRGMKDNQDEELLIGFAEKIIVHTPAMKSYFIGQGVPANKISILYSFDYLTNDIVSKRQISNEIVYAGNLLKSAFLKNIPQDCFKLKFNCYGLPDNVLPQHLNYKGSFKPENVSFLDGSWGLVWDGDSIETCSGDFGEYLKINSPHKVSLYLVSGLPIIIWKYSALADYVVSNNLGVTIESLSDIAFIINKINDKEYERMQDSVRKEGKKLREGKHLLNLLNY